MEIRLGITIFIFCFFVSSTVLAGFTEIDSEEAYSYKEEKPKPSRRANKRPKADRLKELLENEKKLARLLKGIRKVKPKKKERIVALTRTRGIVLNSILAMNVRPSTFLIRLSEHPKIKGGELRCQGMSFQKRVPSKCDLLVIKGREYEIDARIWDLDGAEGIISDYYYHGEEKQFLTSSLASFFQGVVDAAKDRIITPFGEVARSSGKNKALSGIVGVAENARNQLEKSGDKKIEIAYVNSGREVLVFFNRSINLRQ